MSNWTSTREQHLAAVIDLMLAHDIIQLDDPLGLDDYLEQFNSDTSVILTTLQTRYHAERTNLP